tara:strand:+ start:179 stop:1480 length:1302 start_codon:yes stop_codon:yes gene_type:complete
MAKPLNNDQIIRELKPDPSRPFYRRSVHSLVGSGLFVNVTRAGGRKYIARYVIGGKPIDITLGNAMSMSVKEAQAKHQEGYELATLGKDPRLHWKAAIVANQQAQSMQTLFDDWLEHFRSTPSAKTKRLPTAKTAREHEARWNRYCRDRLGPLIVEDVTRPMLVSHLKTLARKAPVEARHQLNVLRAMLDHAEDAGQISDNPMTGVRSKKVGGSAGKIGERVLSVSELVRLWQALDTQNTNGKLSPQVATAIKLLILTGARRTEVTGMRWSELDLDAGVWALPSSRTKNGRAHLVYLSPLACRLLSSMDRANGFVFVGRGDDKPMHPDSVNNAIARLTGTKKRNPGDEPALTGMESFTPHDLRRSAATGWSEQGALGEVIEGMLNHTKERLVQTYNKNRHADAQLRAWLRWAEILESELLGEKVTATVIAIGG